ncbi:MAG: serine/threonine-protein kinase [Myxococcota bacterium]
MLRLGKYLLVESINHGGMADIFLAKTFGYEGADQLIALKCIRSDIALDKNFVSMFIDEAKLTVQLDHVNIARTYDLGRIRDTYYIAMEHVGGRDLRAILDRANATGAGMSYGIVLSIIDQVLEALDYAHRKADMTGVPLRIVHRDVSPHNVIISYSGEVKLIDFGIAKATTQVSRNTTGELRGKYGYMSPEQVQGESVDLRSDIFSAGALLYELITGQRLFTGASDLSILDKVRFCEVYPPSVIMRSVPRDLERVVLRALDPDPGRRYQSASDMRDAAVEVMLRRYGYKAQRDVAAFMAELFAPEIENDRAMIERADRISSMPPDVDEYDGDASKVRPEGTTTKTESEVRPSGVDAQPPRTAPTVNSPPQLEAGTENPVYGGPPPPAAVITSGSRAPDGERLATEVDHRPPPNASQFKTEVIQRSRREAAETDEDISLITLPDVPVRRGNEVPDGEADGLLAQATQVIPSLARGRRRGRIRDFLILTFSVMVAAGLVAFTWVYTQVDPNAIGGIEITSEPSGAEVLLDGVSVGRTPFESRTIRAGSHDIHVELDGYPSVTSRIRITENQILTVFVPFEE